MEWFNLQLMEGSQLNLQWQQNAQDMGYGRQTTQTQGDGFFHPLECEPTLQIGYVLINILDDIFFFVCFLKAFMGQFDYHKD